MPPEWDVDIRPLIKEGAQAVIERHPDVDVDPPTRTFYQLSTGGFMQNTEEITVPTPGDLFDDRDLFDNIYASEFAEPAQRIYDQLPDPPDDDAYSDANRIESIERGLFEFVGVVLNYAGEFQFDEDAFTAAFEEQFEPRFTDREYSRFLLVLKNTSIEPDITIDLETEIQGSPDYLGPYCVDTFRIRSLDRLEEAGIATHEAPGTSVLEPVETLDAGRPNAALEIVLRRLRPYREIAREIDDTEINPWRNPDFDVIPADVYPWQQLTVVIEYLAASVRRCLRLLCPQGTVGYEKGYNVVPSWEAYRGIATPVTFEFEFECPSSTTGTHITEDRALEIPRLWRDHRRRIAPGHDKFQNPLARFERMFSRESLEDQIVDCVVGCETTVLKGGSPGGNKYRLGVRTAVLLGEQNTRNWSSEWIGEFFRTLYEYRNGVVHEDTVLPDKPSGDDSITVEDEEFLASTFLIHARELYADLILEYLDLVRSQDVSIQDVNEQIDNRTLEYGAEIREQLF
ncbi:hypothetical protein G3A49_13480 [Haloferax volcanii]|uniref:Apea-like HEPN domain-containing protein n=1 Tax=Haloferax volcanii TaxID=2246 RepID=A0A6C0UV82_HALVO|nr:HEPN domain-containing protein [Haloferax alexandrinus]QIB79087.1 hypothetical protein G3A49_13480 [Haloferax alexandrinus]